MKTSLITLALLLSAATTLADPPKKLILLDNFYNHETKNQKRYHYTWDDSAPSGFSKLGQLFSDNHCTLDHLTSAPTPADLSRCSVYIIVDPDTEAEAADHKPNYMTPDAAQTIAQWVESGGTLLLLNNDKSNADFQHINILANKFGITFNEDSRNQTPKRDLKRATLDTRSASHPLFQNVPAIYMKEICTLSLTDPAHPILTAPRESAPGTDILIAVARFGKGRVLAIGDPWLYNEYIQFVPPNSSVDNHKAAVNLVQWLLNDTPTSSNQTPTPFMTYPPGTAPEIIGKRIAENLLSREFMRYNKGKGGIHYAEACTAIGALQFSALTKDADLQKKLVARYAPILTPEGDALVSKTFHVDHSVFGIVPFEIYLRTNDPAYLALAKKLVDDQWAAPLLENGLTRQTRWWIDDMYMVGQLLSQASRATKDPLYADRLGLFLTAYLDRLQQPTGLFYHGPDFHFFWGRGNGWVAVSLAEALTVLPENSPHRPRILEGYKKMMAALLTHQAPTGLWRQLIDKPESWDETSCTAMFTYAFITGVKNGWLDQSTYAPPSQKAYLALVKHLDEKSELTDICVGTSQSKDITYYLTRPKKTGDLHGQAPLLWCTTALLR